MKKITLLLAAFFAISYSYSQTTLVAGDIAFVGSGVDDGGPFGEYAAFVLLKDIDAATQIIFTDRGWSDTTGFGPVGSGDGQLTWTSGVARSAGDIITLDLSFGQLSDGGAYAIQGDQLFAIQGSIASPVFIAGLHYNVEPLGATGATVTTNDANWDGNNINNDESALPNALTTGDTAVRLFGANGAEQDNFQFSCSLAGANPITGTPAQIRAIVHNIANWTVTNTSGFDPAIEVGCTISIMSATDNTPPSITCAPTPPNSVAGVNGMAMVPDLVSGSSATDDVTADGDITITQSPAAGTSVPVGVSMVTVTAMDEAGNAASCMIDVTIVAPPSTALEAGDVAFVGINLDGNDAFAFILLKDIIAGTSITFTDCGVENPNTITCSNGDSSNTWFAPMAMTAGSIVELDGSFFPGSPLAAQGDQILAYQGTMMAPTFLGGIHVNVETGVTNDEDWDGGASQLDESALPDQLTNGVNALRVHDNEIDVDNWQLDCSSIPMELLTGTKEQIAAVINDLQYWISDNTQVFSPTVNAACVFTVIEDNVPPEITGCPTSTNPAGLDASCENRILDYTQFITVTDAVDANPTITQQPAAGTTFSMPTEVTITATDFAGNSSICMFTVDVVDALGPTAVCTDVMVELDENGTASIMAELLDGGSTDNCSTELTFSASQTDFSCADVGDVQVTLTVMDESGNSDTCMATVTVTDVTAPTINCPVNVMLTSSMSETLTAEQIGMPTADDNCEVASIVGTRLDTNSTDLTAASYPQGVTTIRWVVTDINGLTNMCDQTITIASPPSVSVPNVVGDTQVDAVAAIEAANLTVGMISMASDPSVPEGNVISQNPTGGTSIAEGSSVDLVVSSGPGCTVDITTQPMEQTVCSGESPSFSVEATGTGTLRYQWQVGNGVDFGDFANGAPTGQNPVLNLTGTTVSADGNQYRVIVTSDNGTPGNMDDDCTMTSNAVLLNVNPLPIASFTALSDLMVDAGVQMGLGGGLPAQGTVMGDSGMYSGPGVTDNGDGTYNFDPAVAGVGVHEITYAYTDENGCSGLASDEVEVTMAMPTVLSITGFNLIDADNDVVLFPIVDGQQININDLPTMNLNIEAVATDDTESVRLELSGTQSRGMTENFAPYALFGDSGGNFRPNVFALGNYDLMGTPYSDNRLQGTMGTPLAINFDFVDTDPLCADFELTIPEMTGPSTCGGNDGVLRLTVNDSRTVVVEFFINGEFIARVGVRGFASGLSLTTLSAGEFLVEARTTEGCTETRTVILEDPELPEVTLAPFDAVLDTDEAFALMGGSPMGGEYSGDGVTDGMFDPSIGVGSYEITYTFTDPVTNCTNSAMETLMVTSAVQTNAITGFVLVDGETNEDIGPITQGGFFILTELPTTNLNIRADATGDVESVFLEIAGGLMATRRENVEPYALFGDRSGDYFSRSFTIGNFSVSATPYTGNSLSGDMGATLSVDFSIILPPAVQNQINLSIYPNPSVSSVMATFEAEEEVQVEVIQVFDIQGRLIRSYDAKRVKEGDGYRLQVYDMPVGSYFLRTTDAKGFDYQQQMVIER